MVEEPQALNLESTLAALRARAVLIVMCLVVVAASAFGFSEQQTKQYTASAKLLFRAPALDQQASGLPSAAAANPQRDADTNVKLVKLGEVAAQTARQISRGLTPEEVLNSVSVATEGPTDIATVSVTTTSPSQAALIANTFTQQFIETRRRIDRARVLAARQLVERQIAQLPPKQRSGLRGQSMLDRSESLRILATLQTGNAELVERASPPSSPSAPKVIRNTVLGAGLGLLLGVGIAFLVTRLDRRMKEPEDLQNVFGLPVLGVVPESDAYSVSLNGDASAPLPAREGEAFRLLRAHLRYFNVDRDVRTVLVTSAASGEGKTTVARFLAQAAATMGTKTLLIEADLRRPSLTPRLGPGHDVGLGAVLIGAASASTAVRSIAVPNSVNGGSSNADLDVLAAGSIPPNPAELIESQAMQDLLRWATTEYELVVIDTPPLTVVSDAIPLLRKVDGVLIVSRLGRSTHDAAARMRERLASLGAPMLGVVGNAYTAHKSGSYGYDYDYDYQAKSVAHD